MIGANVYQNSLVRRPVAKNLLSLLQPAVYKEQPKRNISVWLPSLVVAGNTRRLVQVSKAPCQLSGEWTAVLAVMNDADDGWFRKGTINHYGSFDHVRSEAKQSELKVCVLRGELKQVRKRQS